MSNLTIVVTNPNGEQTTITPFPAIDVIGGREVTISRSQQMRNTVAANDPFQAAVPCHVKWPVMCHDPKHSPIPHTPQGCENPKYLKRYPR